MDKNKGFQPVLYSKVFDVTCKYRHTEPRLEVLADLKYNTIHNSLTLRLHTLKRYYLYGLRDKIQSHFLWRQSRLPFAPSSSVRSEAEERSKSRDRSFLWSQFRQQQLLLRNLKVLAPAGNWSLLQKCIICSFYSFMCSVEYADVEEEKGEVSPEQDEVFEAPSVLRSKIREL